MLLHDMKRKEKKEKAPNLYQLFTLFRDAIFQGS